MFRGRPVIGAIAGFFFFFFIALDLMFFGVIPLKSAVITILPIVGIIAGIVWGEVGLVVCAEGRSPPARIGSVSVRPQVRLDPFQGMEDSGG